MCTTVMPETRQQKAAVITGLFIMPIREMKKMAVPAMESPYTMPIRAVKQREESVIRHRSAMSTAAIHRKEAAALYPYTTVIPEAAIKRYQAVNMAAVQ